MSATAGDRLAEFAVWLRQKRLVPEHRIPYMVGWVQKFQRQRAGWPKEGWQDALQGFLNDLGEGWTPSWQIRQAAEQIIRPARRRPPCLF